MAGKLKYQLALALPVAGLVLMGVQLPAWLTGSSADLVYDTVEISRGPIRKVVSTSGPVRALVTVSVGSQLSGQIRELKVDFNTEVKAGDELAVIDDKSFLAKVAQAKADLVAAQATLASQEAALVKAQAIEHNARRLVGRQQTLAAKGIAAPTALDIATRDAEVATAEVEVAKAQMENARATIEQRQAQLSYAEIDLERTRIRSPIEGTVIARTVDVGQTVAASLQAPELFKIAQDLSRIRIEAQVSEADVGAVAVGNSVEFKVDAYPARRFQGKVSQVRLGATELNNIVTYTVMIEAENNDRKLLPGMTADAKIKSETIDQALRIPTDALRFKPRRGVASAPVRPQPRLRLKRELELATRELPLTEQQADRVFVIMTGASAERRTNARNGAAAASSASSPALPDEPNSRLLPRLTQAIAGVITIAQRGAFESWKARREAVESRISRRDVTIWVLDATGAVKDRQIDLGLMDDDFAEVLGDELTEGDKVIFRSSQLGQR